MPFDLAESFIAAAERELGAILPASYRNAMLRENGGAIEWEGEDWDQYPIADSSDQKRVSRTANNILVETAQCRAWFDFPEHALAIAGNGEGDKLVFLKQDQFFDSALYVWRHESGQIAKLVDDFSELKAP